VPSSHEVSDGGGSFTMIGDGDPYLDVCSNPTVDQATIAGRNIGDMLNARGITWGFFEGGFDLTVVNPNGTTGCLRSTRATQSPFPLSQDYIPHHQPFQYLKATAFEDGHAGYSDPLDEQHFVVRVLNALQRSPFWSSTAVVITYDDSDGFYDHQMPPIVNPSFSVADKLNGPKTCNNGLQQGRATRATPLNGALGYPAQGRCGYGTRIPLLVVSPFAKSNYVDHTLIDQTSILRFIEDNWLFGERVQPDGSFDTIAGPINNMFDFAQQGNNDEPRRLILDPVTGAVVSAPGDDQGQNSNSQR